MTTPNLPASAADISKLVARVEQLERLFRTNARLLALSELTDVRISALTDADVLTWVDADEKWENAAGGGGGYWERTSDDLHLDPTSTAGLETFTFDYTDGGGNRYKILSDTGDLVLENRVTGAVADVDLNSSAGDSSVLVQGQVTDSGNTSKAFLSSAALANAANTEIEARDGHSHTAKIEVNADNANTPKTYGRVFANEMLFDLDNAAPPDGELLAGWFAFWLDDTNGAAKLMVKAKQANGTAVTGSVTLA